MAEMDVKEKLVELIRNAHTKCKAKKTCHECEQYGNGSDCVYAFTADDLIAHSVTVQEWISVKERTPKEKGCYLIAGNHWWDGKPVAREAYWNGDDWLSCYDKANISRRVTHWCDLPQPPKGE